MTLCSEIAIGTQNLPVRIRFRFRLRFCSRSGISPHSPNPLWMRRGAQGKADKGPRLSEAKPSSSGTPLFPSTAGCPKRSAGTQEPGSPFLGLLSFGEAKDK